MNLLWFEDVYISRWLHFPDFPAIFFVEKTLLCSVAWVLWFHGWRNASQLPLGSTVTDGVSVCVVIFCCCDDCAEMCSEENLVASSRTDLEEIKYNIHKYVLINYNHMKIQIVVFSLSWNKPFRTGEYKKQIVFHPYAVILHLHVSTVAQNGLTLTLVLERDFCFFVSFVFTIGSLAHLECVIFSSTHILQRHTPTLLLIISDPDILI